MNCVSILVVVIEFVFVKYAILSHDAVMVVNALQDDVERACMRGQITGSWNDLEP